VDERSFFISIVIKIKIRYKKKKKYNVFKNSNFLFFFILYYIIFILFDNQFYKIFCKISIYRKSLNNEADIFEKYYK